VEFLLFDDWGGDSSYPNFRSGGVNPHGGDVTKGQRSFFLIIGGALVASQSSPHRHEADGGGVTKGWSAFFLIIREMVVAGQSSPRRHEADGGDVTTGQAACGVFLFHHRACGANKH
jgi:hypothetical protein